MDRQGAHLARRAPRANWGTSWGRVPTRTMKGVVVDYRVFIRDRDSRRLYCEWVRVPASMPRAEVAKRVRAARAQVRWCRDQVELARLGLQDMTPRPVPA